MYYPIFFVACIKKSSVKIVKYFLVESIVFEESKKNAEISKNFHGRSGLT